MAGIRYYSVGVARSHNEGGGTVRVRKEYRPKRKFLKSMSFEKAVSKLEGSEKNSLLVMNRDLNPTTAPIGESPMVQFYPYSI